MIVRPRRGAAAETYVSQKAKYMHNKKEKSTSKVFIIIFAVLAVLIIGALIAYFAWEKAPAIAGEKAAAEAPVEAQTAEEATAAPAPSPTPVLDSAIAPDTESHDGV